MVYGSNSPSRIWFKFVMDLFNISHPLRPCHASTRMLVLVLNELMFFYYFNQMYTDTNIDVKILKPKIVIVYN